MNRTIIIVVVTLLTIVGIYRYGFNKGWGERDAEMQSEIAIKNEESRAREQKLSTQLNITSAQLQEATNVVTQKQSALDRAISAGRVRLPAAGCVQASPSSTPASGNQTDAAQPNRQADGNSDADRETLKLIAQIAADGDRAIVQLNACVDAYNQVREQINGQ